MAEIIKSEFIMTKQKINADIAIIGGGAAGLAAAVSIGKAAYSAHKKIKTVIIEKEQKTGRKLLATGNGKCNMTNYNMSAEYYNGSCKRLAAELIKSFDTERLTEFFFDLGIVCKSDSQGRVYPNSEQAGAVLDILRLNISRYGILELCGQKVLDISVKDDFFEAETPDSIISAKKLILAVGGAAQPKLGSDGSAYAFARRLGIECSPIFPSLVPIKVKYGDMAYLKGVRTAAKVSLIADEKVVCCERGELQLTQSGLSGICIFQLSRYVNEFFSLNTVKGKKVSVISVSVDLMPDTDSDKLREILLQRRKNLEFMPAEEFFTGLLNKKIGICLLKQLNIKTKNKTVKSLSEKDILRIASVMKNWSFVPSEMSDIQSAQVTAGGIAGSEINRRFESVKYKGLYIVGEALDADGLCGGYNLHWAFAGGITAGYSAAKKLLKK